MLWLSLGKNDMEISGILYKSLCSLFFCEQVTDKKFDNKVEWGIDLASEHERYSDLLPYF